MKTEQEKNESIFKLFVSRDTKYKQAMLNPFKNNGKIYATEGHCLVSMLDNGFEYKNEFEDKAPDVEKAIPEPNTKQLISFDRQRLEALKTEDEFEYNDVKEIECGLCNGHGEVDHQEYYKNKYYDVSFECPVCDGDGSEQKPTLCRTGKKTFPTTYIKLGGCYFNISFFNKLFQVQDIVGGEIFITHQSESNKANLFEIGDYTILLMPVMPHDFSDIPVIEIEIKGMP